MRSVKIHSKWFYYLFNPLKLRVFYVYHQLRWEKSAFCTTLCYLLCVYYDFLSCFSIHPELVVPCGGKDVSLL